MLTDGEIEWLAANHPDLKVNAERTEVKGDLTLIAAYNRTTDEFTPLMLPGQSAPGLILTGTYSIHIKKRADKRKPPSLRILGEKIPTTQDRHFYDNGIACLCGLVEEIEFMNEGFLFLKYLERLVYPFLYGQAFYDLNGTWPWDDYAHGVAGIIESYYLSGQTREHAEACLRRLQASQYAWPRINNILRNKEKFHQRSNCFCVPRHIIKAHPGVWFGLVKLKQAIVSHGISIS